MPFYEYECPACKYYAEIMQKISDAPLNKCPSCGRLGMKKLVSAPVFRLKGGGWYETDFKSDKENKRNLHAGEKEEAKPETRAETKEAKAEGKEPKEARETKEAKDTRAAEPKTSADSAARAVTAPGKAARAGAPRRPVRTAVRKAARKRRR